MFKHVSLPLAFMRVLALAGLVAVFSTACAVPHGPYLRLATATRAELVAAKDKPEVWYEFREGDVIPVQLGYLGAAEGGPAGPVAVHVRHKFYLVMTKGAQVRISFDGESFAPPMAMQSMIAVMPTDEGGGLAWLLYMGAAGDPEGALKKLLEERSPDETKSPADRKADRSLDLRKE
jgi:hypothetical protein